MCLGLAISTSIKAPCKVKAWSDTSQGCFNYREARQTKQASESDCGESSKNQTLTNQVVLM